MLLGSGLSVGRHKRARSIDKLLPMSRDFPPDSNKDGDPSKRRTTASVRGSTVAQPPNLKNASSYAVCIVLIFAMTNFGQISAQISFNIPQTGYVCAPNATSANILCLGGAHAYNTSTGPGPGRLSLILEETNIDNTGIAYYKDPVRFLDWSTLQAASFNTSFVIDQVKWNVSDPWAGDGLTFVINADNTVVGSDGGNLGIFEVPGGTTPNKSIIVEFDTWLNPAAPAYDINDNHVSFDFGNITHRAARDCLTSGIILGEGATIYAWVEYSSKTQQLEARLSNSNSRPVSPLLNYEVDLFDVIEEYMWVGFSAGASSHYTNYYIGDWKFESYYDGKSGGKKLDLIVGISVGIPAFLLACIGIFLLRVCCSKSRVHIMKKDQSNLGGSWGSKTVSRSDAE